MVLRGWGVGLVVAWGVWASGVFPLPAQQSSLRTAVQTVQVPSRRPDEAVVVSTLAMSPDGAWLAAAGDDHLVRVFRLGTNQVVATLDGHADWVRTVVFSPDGRWLLSAGDDRRVMRYEVGSWRLSGQWVFPGRAVSAMIALPKGVAVVGYDTRVHLFSYQGESLGSLATDCRDLRAVVLSPQGKMLAAAGQDGTLYVWSWPERQRLVRQKVHRRRIRALAFSPDGKLLASAGEGTTVALWNLEENQLLRHMPSRPGRVLAMTFLDSQHLATAGTDNQIRIWDLRTGQTVLRLVGHKGSVTSLVWIPAQRTLISGSYDTSLRYWNLGPESALRLRLNR